MSWATHHIKLLRETGAPVQFRPYGRSMEPRIASGQLVTVGPVDLSTQLAVGDVVLCTLHYVDYLHEIKAVRSEQSGLRYLIGNMRGHTNGWALRNEIHGRLLQVHAS